MPAVMADPPLLKHTQVLRERLPLAGALVADIGCGDGALLRVLARSGARAIGIEPGAAQLARARAARPAGNEAYIRAVGEALPLAGGCLDAAIYFNSLHHVPVAQQRPALMEALRVLRSGGLLYVQEPLAEGAYFEMMRPVEDETKVRERAYDAICAIRRRPDVDEVEEFIYRAPFREQSFEDFRAAMQAIDPARRGAIQSAGESLRKDFLAAAEQRDDGFWFEIPSRLNLLRRT